MFNHFSAVANRYCELIESTQGQIITYGIAEFSEIISSLYSWALRLPYIEPSEKDITTSDIDINWKGFNGFDFYWEVHPFEDGEKVCGSITDDIIDIYKDIKSGLLLYNSEDSEDKVNAQWYWKYHFDIHWGEHAVNVLRILHIAKERF